MNAGSSPSNWIRIRDVQASFTCQSSFKPTTYGRYNLSPATLWKVTAPAVCGGKILRATIINKRKREMGGVVGAISSKLVLTAAAMLITANIDRHKISGALDWNTPNSSIICGTNARSHLKHICANTDRVNAQKVLVGFTGAEFGAELPVATEAKVPGAEVVFGRDALSEHVFELDFHRKNARLIARSEFRRAVRQLDPVNLMVLDDGKIGCTIRIGNAATENAVIDLTGLPSTFASGAVAQLNPSMTRTAVIGDGPAQVIIPISSTPTADMTSQTTIGVDAFAGRRVVLDLSHMKIWVSRIT